MSADTSGFYSLPTYTNGMPSFIIGNKITTSHYTIIKADRATYTYPHEGIWYWFDSYQDAVTYFGNGDGKNLSMDNPPT